MIYLAYAICFAAGIAAFVYLMTRGYGCSACAVLFVTCCISVRREAGKERTGIE